MTARYEPSVRIAPTSGYLGPDWKQVDLQSPEGAWLKRRLELEMGLPATRAELEQHIAARPQQPEHEPARAITWIYEEDGNMGTRQRGRLDTEERKQRLIEALQSGSMRRKVLIRAGGGSYIHTSRVLDMLLSEGVIVDDEPGRYSTMRLASQSKAPVPQTKDERIKELTEELEAARRESAAECAAAGVAARDLRNLQAALEAAQLEETKVRDAAQYQINKMLDEIRDLKTDRDQWGAVGQERVNELTKELGDSEAQLRAAKQSLEMQRKLSVIRGGELDRLPYRQCVDGNLRCDTSDVALHQHQGSWQARVEHRADCQCKACAAVPVSAPSSAEALAAYLRQREQEITRLEGELRKARADQRSADAPPAILAAQEQRRVHLLELVARMADWFCSNREEG